MRAPDTTATEVEAGEHRPRLSRPLPAAREDDQRLRVTRYAWLLRLSLGIIYVHFGFLKFFPDLSSAELLAGQTVMAMTWYWFDSHTAMLWLATLECVIGLGFLLNLFPRWTLALFVFHMCGTFMPLFLLPEVTFNVFPMAPNLIGQYVLKNIVFVAAVWIVLFPEAYSRRIQETSHSNSTRRIPK